MKWSSRKPTRIDYSQVGHPAWNKGIPMTPEQKEQSSLAHMGQIAWNKGVPMTDEQKAKLSAVQIGKKCPNRSHPQTLETRAKDSIAHKGKLLSAEHRAKLSAALTGLPSHNWKGGPTPEKTRGYAIKHAAKRRGLGYVYLNKPFSGCVGHHVDKEQVINMPAALHRSVYHRQSDGRGMAAINAIAYNFLFKQEVQAAMAKVTS
jgi:hypothetical protein